MMTMLSIHQSLFTNISGVVALLVLQPVCSYQVVGPASRVARMYRRSTKLLSTPNDNVGKVSAIVDHASLSVDDAWEDHFYASQSFDLGPNDDERTYQTKSHAYTSNLLRNKDEHEIDAFLREQQEQKQSLGKARNKQNNDYEIGRRDTYVEEPYRQLRLLRRRLPDPLWLQIRMEAEHALTLEPDAGPQLYQHVLRQPSLIDALAVIISHEIETELIPATALQILILDQLRLRDDVNIHLDLVASANRKPTEDSTALDALLFHKGLHALVCYRVAHRLWQAGRTGMAMYMQSTVSSKYSADIHPAAQIEGGIFLSVGVGVAIGETGTIGRDVTILQGVTLGGTGKETGDRHPKVEDGVILHCGATVLGNIPVGKGAVVTAKSIVTKPVPALARVSGVPATVKSYRELRDEGFNEDEDNNEDVDKKKCDLDCKMSQLYEGYFEELEALIEMELCIDSGSSDCWGAMTEILNAGS